MKLYPFQKEGVRQMIRFKGRALLADEMGLGKTVQALELLRLYPKKRPVLIICPSSIKWIWEEHVKKMLRTSPLMLSGRTPSTTILPLTRPVTIINYDVVASWEKVLKQAAYHIVILDEAHYIKNWGAARTRATRRIVQKSPCILALTGTPILSRPNELWSIIKAVKPGLFGKKREFQERYCDPKWRPWLPPMQMDYSGASNMDELNHILTDRFMIRRLKKDVLPELPAKTRTIVPLEIEMGEYRKANNAFIKWLAEMKEGDKKKKALKAKGMTKLAHLRQVAAQLKMKLVFDWVDNFLEESSDKLVLFAHHKAIIEQLRSRYSKECVVVSGATTQAQRKKNVQRFQENKKIRVFIGNIKAAGQGLTLTAASTLAFVELDPVPGNVIQAEDRIHRIGQTRGAMIYYLIAKDTVEEYLCRLIQKKQQIVSAVLDGGEQAEDINIYNQLIQCIKEK